ncbi:hypothetical protein A3207_07665 [Candidatus Methanomassiliicoccus intestinalis]|jgi:hypothetical protein|uniref:Uncharacterized protein n=1 Tax=Candidatus Methanomassiliicoccus intestinalis TaxID=1406512 RepID=A0A8J8PDA5_9ARCH|nr:MAG: hypothetical protein A3207_07665 [Candidatus Methanomassiliicoccus intestinalis]
MTQGKVPDYLQTTIERESNLSHHQYLIQNNALWESRFSFVSFQTILLLRNMMTDQQKILSGFT